MMRLFPLSRLAHPSASTNMDKIGKVAVLATLGAGANSSIVRVRREEDGREYALKLVPIEDDDDKKYLDQARHEFRVGQMLDHPAVMKVYCLETETDWRFRVKKAKLLTEYAPGETLDNVRLHNPAKMSRVFERVASGLAHLHKNGVIHADIKPNNVILGRGTQVKIIDFGLAWVKGEPKGRVQGTPGYIAPETATNKMVNERTDIYNFGAMMYRLVTFKLPPDTIPVAEGLELTAETFDKLLVPVSQIMPGVHPELADLIHRCLSFKALDRPARMSEIQGILDRLADEAAAEHGDPDGE